MPKLDKNLKINSQTLRKNMTKEERHLWYDFLKSYPVQIKRQKVIGNYIVDFYCSNAKVAIELDGSQHYELEGKKKDIVRDNYLNELGIKVLRYSNFDINRNFIAACEEIDKVIKERLGELQEAKESKEAKEPESTKASECPHLSPLVTSSPKGGRQKVYFVGAGCGAADLITVRGMRLLKKADVIIYAGSLVNPELLLYAKKECEIFNSATMTLEEVMEVMVDRAKSDKNVVRLHTGEPSIYGAVREQMQILDDNNISYESCPGVSACFGAAASLNLEYTLPEVSQSLIITRLEGRTSVPKKESIESFASHNTSMAIYLSTGMLEELSKRLIDGGYSADTPAAIVYKATWPDEEKYVCTVETLPEIAKEHNIKNLAVVLVGDVISKSGYALSKLYSKDFETAFRQVK